MLISSFTPGVDKNRTRDQAETFIAYGGICRKIYTENVTSTHRKTISVELNFLGYLNWHQQLDTTLGYQILVIQIGTVATRM